jgi:UDP-N-acetylmuramate dehydrogenase
MMTRERTTRRLLDRLPAVRGRYREGTDLARTTWFRVGGPAEVLFRPADTEDLCAFLANRPRDVPVTVIGVGSNLLVRDGGVPGVVIRLGGEFATIDIDGTEVSAGAGALDGNVAHAAAVAGIAGLEFLAGIPGTIGGALRMNAGAYGREMSDVLVEAEAVGPDGARHVLTPTDMGMDYRHTGVPADIIFTGARLRGKPGVRTEIAYRIKEIQDARAATQPVRTRTGGSTFRNPGGRAADGTKAWQLIDAAGCRGLMIGGARVSPQHCNFLINEGTATAADIEVLGEEVRRRVLEQAGVMLEWEIRIIGVPLKGHRT